MELSSEDSLRLNVMLANEVQAVRINESTMTVYGLSEQGESVIKLNPNCRDDKYLRGVRELLSTHVLGSPGGYPVYLKRWTRMGQARDESLERLLMLGEPEAVVAVVHAGGLTGELARRAWWSMPDAENARCMLDNGGIAQAPIGRELAEFLVEFLPFEEDPEAMMETVRLVLQPGLVDEETRLALWRKAKLKNSYYVGFLQTLPDALPDPLPPHPAWDSVRGQVEATGHADDPLPRLLIRCLSSEGQSFLRIAAKVLRKPANQEVVVRLLNVVGDYFAPAAVMEERQADIERCVARARRRCDEPAMEAAWLVERFPGHREKVVALLALTEVSEALVIPVFARTDAIGSVMRRKIEPVTSVLLELVDELGPAGNP